MRSFEHSHTDVPLTVLHDIQAELLKNLEAGPIIEGTGGLRKLRIADAYLLALYAKDEKDDISQEEKRILRALVAKLKKEVR